MGLITPFVETAIERTMSGDVDARIETITLSAGDEDGFSVVLVGVAIEGAIEDGNLALPHIYLNFEPSDLLSGSLGPHKILLEKPQLRIVRRGDRRFTLDYGNRTRADQPANVFSNLTGGQYFRGAFNRAELRQARIEFLDESTGRRWLAENANAFIERNENRYIANIIGAFNIEGKEASLVFDAWFDPATEIISTELSVERAPVGDLLATFLGETANFMDAPITGRATLDISSDGRIMSSYLSGKAGKGNIQISDREFKIEEIEAAAAFNPSTNEFDIQVLNIVSDPAIVRMTGNLQLEQGSENQISSVRFDVIGDVPQVNVDGFFAAPIVVDEFKVTGRFDAGTRGIDVDGLTLAVGDNVFAGSGTFNPQEDLSPEIRVQALASGEFDKETLMSLWPLGLASGGRGFVEARVFDAVFSGLDFEMDLAAGEITEIGHLPDNAMALRFQAKGATIQYVPGMTPLKGVDGNGALLGNSFKFNTKNGTVGNIRLLSGEVDIPNLRQFRAPTYYRFKARGDSDEILSVLDQKPLSLLSSTPLRPSQFAGEAELEVEIMRPNALHVQRREYEYRGGATFDNLSIDAFYGELGLNSSKGKLELRPGSMTIKGQASVGDTPLDIQWDQRFFGSGDRSRMVVAGVANSATGDLVGIPTRKYVRGPVPISAIASGDIGEFRNIDIQADFSNATVILDLFDWQKDLNQKMLASISIEQLVDEISLNSIKINGEGVDVSGRLTINRENGLQEVDLESFRLDGSTDLSVTVLREGEALQVALIGEYLNLTPLLDEFIGNRNLDASSDNPTLMTGRIRIDKVDTRNDIAYRDLSVDWRTSEYGFDDFDLTALGQDGLPLRANLKRTGALYGPRQVIEARADNIGTFLSGVFGISSVQGGQGVMEFLINDSVDGTGGLSKGKLEARDIKIVNAPLLAKVFAAGSLEGLNSLLNNDGIEIAQAFADISFDGRGIEISDARAAGTSLGITGRGVLSDGGKTLALTGAVAPAYQVNSFLGKTPVIGDIFVSREGEGVLALTYDISGSVNEPRVSVNPLSALAPGFLRRIFDRSESVESDPAAPESASETED